MRRIIAVLTLTFIFFGTIFSVAFGDHSSEPTFDQLSDQRVELISSSLEGVTLSLETDDFEIQAWENELGTTSSTYDQIIIPGASHTQEAGKPQLPVYSTLIGVPPGAEISLHLMESEPVLLEGQHFLPPAPQPKSPVADLQPGEMEYIIDQATYETDALYPEVPAKITGESWVRDQRMVRVNIYPFQYNSVQQTLTWHKNIRVQIKFTGVNTALLCSDCSENAFEAALESTLINYETARNWRSRWEAGSRENLSGGSHFNPLGNRYRIVVREDGVYRLTYDDLLAAGMDVGNVDPQTFALSNQSRDISIYVSGEGDGSFDQGDYVVFFGEAFSGDLKSAQYEDEMLKEVTDPNQDSNNWFWTCYNPENCELSGYFERYTDENIYWLMEGGTPGPRMSSVDGTPGSAAVPAYYPETIHAEEQLIWWSWEFYGQEVFFWKRMQTYATVYNFPITLTNIANVSYAASVRGSIGTRNSDPLQSPDHHAVLTFNTAPTPVDDHSWDGPIRYNFEGTVDQSDLLEGTNNLFVEFFPTALPGPFTYFDWYDVTYARDFVAVNDSLIFKTESSGTWKYQTDNFTSNATQVYDISDPITPVRVLNPQVSGGGPFTVSFEVNHGTDGRYAVAGSNGWRIPDSITYYEPPDFASMPETEYLVISHEEFLGGSQLLANHRASEQEFSTTVIDVQDLYNEFNDGIYHPIAIKNFLTYAFENWSAPPSYVVLVGNGHWNFLNAGKPGDLFWNPPTNYMPPNLAYVDPWQGEVDSANLLATIVGDDPMPDLMISRIPVGSIAEFNIVLAKITGYDDLPVGNWQKHMIFVADNTPDPAGDFVALAELIIDDFLEPTNYFIPDRIYLDDFGCPGAGCNDVTDGIINSLNITGSLITQYIGHASLTRWTHEEVFVNADIEALTNIDKPTIILSMTCLDGYASYPGLPSIAQDIMTHDNGGAVTTFSPTGLGVATGHDALHSGFYSVLFDTDHIWEMGPATIGAKMELWGTGFNQDLMHTFTIYGDPALLIISPFDVEVVTDESGLSGPPGSMLEYSVDITNIGLLTDAFDISVEGNNWATIVSPSTVGPLAPDETASVDVTVTIPPDALGFQTDEVTVIATSQGNVRKSGFTVLTSTAETDGLIIDPPTQEDEGAPGENLVYNVTVTNTSNTDDTFTLELNREDWSTQIPASVGPIPPNQSSSFEITVTIPPDALGEETGTSSVKITSQLVPENNAVATVISRAITEGLIVTPLFQARSGTAGGDPVVFTLQITNTNSTYDVFHVDISGNSWPTTVDIELPLIQPGETWIGTILVEIPLDQVGEMDTATFTVYPDAEPANTITGVVETTALIWYTNLPIMQR